MNALGEAGLAVRPITTLEDVEHLRQIRNECRLYMTNDIEVIAPQAQQAWFEAYRRNRAEISVWLILREDRRHVLGFLSLRFRDQHGAREAVITLGLKSSERDKGYGTAIYAFARAIAGCPVRAEIRATNERSIRAAIKAGYVRATSLLDTILVFYGQPTGETSMVDLFRPYMSEHAAGRVTEALQYRPDGRLFIGQGEQVAAFEHALKSALGAETDVLTVNSGTSALTLAMYMAGVGPGKTVISTPMTCSATNSPIVTQFARVVWADVDPLTGLISPESVRDRVQWCLRHLSQAPAAIVAVDWAGRLCDYPALIEAATIEMFGRTRRIPIIQDAAHAFLAHDESGLTGAKSGADYICYSFQAIKHLTTVDGGALVCKDPQDTETARLLRWYGLDRTAGDSFRCSQDIEQPGFKFHMNDVAATIGLANLPEMQDIVGKHRGNALYYTRVLERVDGAIVTLPTYTHGSSWWLYTVLVEHRDDFIAFMRAKGVECSPVHRRNDAHPGFVRRTYGYMPLPGVDHFADREVAIPVGWWLTDEDRSVVADAILEWDALQRP